jgi:acyl carrier protein
VHEKTGIDIPERDYPKLSTVNDVVAYLMDAQQRGPGAKR